MECVLQDKLHSYLIGFTIRQNTLQRLLFLRFMISLLYHLALHNLFKCFFLLLGAVMFAELHPDYTWVEFTVVRDFKIEECSHQTFH